MRLPKEAYQMQQTIGTHLPHLSQAQLAGLVLWVCGAILAGSAGQNAVASALSPWGSWNSRRQYLREWLYDGSDRARPCQTELDVSLCFAPLLRWVLAWWHSGRLALAIDPTLKGDQTTAIVVSVVCRQRGLPRLRHPRGLAHHARQPARVLDGPDSGTAAGAGPGGAPGNDRNRPVRPRLGQPQVVATDHGSGLASLHEVSQKHHLLRRWRPPAARASLCPPSGYRVGREGHRLWRPRRQTPLHPAGGLVCRAAGTMDHPDRSSSGSSRGELVRSRVPGGGVKESV